MATTVSYKEDTLTTIEYDSSATLETANTWLEDDIVINVDPLNLQSKTVTPNTSTQIITQDNEYEALEQVTVNPIPSNYIVPTGNYAITSNGTNINIAQYATVSVNVDVQTLVNNQNKTVTPTTSQQNITYDNGYTGLGTVTVNAMPTGSVNDQFTFTLNTTNGRVIASTEVTAGYINSGTISGNYDIPLVPVAQRSITPSTQTQTIAAGYLIPTSGIEIEGDADLIPSNILSTANIFGVQGSVNIRTYYSGSSSPSSSLGNNGDIYFESAK